MTITLFLSEISESCVCDYISCFKNHIAAAIINTQKICDSYEAFIFEQAFQLFKDDLLLLFFYTDCDSFS